MHSNFQNLKPEILEQNFAFLFKDKTLKPVKRYDAIRLDNLVGIERQKQKLLKNTQKFVKGLPANNALLWGERGTGKSSLVKAVAYHFKDEGMKIIQVLKRDLMSVLDLYDIIYEFPQYRFILFIDDLSFEPHEEEFKEIKTVLNGTIQAVPENLLFYVTSNRKNLVPVNFSERQMEDDTRTIDLIEERLSLVDRFGLRIGFFSMDKETFMKTVEMYAQIFNISLPKEELFKRAKEYIAEAGKLNGRTALQFIKSL